jgi:Family of unknown function (DUF5681)
MAQKKVKPTKGYRVGYGRPPAEFRYQKGKSGNPSGKKREPPSTAADLRALLERALNAKVQSGAGAGAKLVTTAAAGIEQLVAQYAAGDRHARRDVFALAKEAGIDLMGGQNKKVVVAALAAEDEQIILDFLRRHGVEPEQPPATNADAISDTPTKHGDEGELQ